MTKARKHKTKLKGTKRNPGKTKERSEIHKSLSSSSVKGRDVREAAKERERKKEEEEEGEKRKWEDREVAGECGGETVGDA
jgi:hypothetical protein